MSISKAFIFAQFSNTGAPAAISISDEGTPLGTIVKSLDFRGNPVQTTADAQGNVIVNISSPQTIDIVDGGNF